MAGTRSLTPTSATPRAAGFVARLAPTPVCAAIVDGAHLERALTSRAPIIFLLRGDGLRMAPTIDRIHAAGKLVAVHLDLIDGIAADVRGVAWLAAAGSDAIITSHGRLLPTIRDAGRVAIHRVLLSRRSHVDTAMAAAARSHPDILEVLPGVVLPGVTQLLPRFGIPLLAGGFVRSVADARAAIAAGAVGVTTSAPELWDLGAA